LTTIVMKYELVSTTDDIIGSEGDFSLATGGIESQCWNGHSRDSADELSHNLNTDTGMGPEMIGSPGEITLKQVVRFYPHPKEAQEKFLQGFRSVIHSL